MLKARLVILKILSVFALVGLVNLVDFESSYGVSVIPFIHSFDSDEKEEQTTQYYIGNDSDEFMAFMLTIHRRHQKIDGSDILEKDENSFVVMPSQIIIPPHTQRTVKVRWMGNKEYRDNPKIEQAYRLCIDQFPIKMKLEKVTKKEKNGDDKEQLVLKMPKEKKKKGMAQIQVSYKIWTSLYAAPKESASDMVVEKTDAQSITIRNKGTRHGELKEIRTVMCDGKPLEAWFDTADLEKVVLAGTSRRFIKNSHNSRRKNKGKTNKEINEERKRQEIRENSRN